MVEGAQSRESIQQNLVEEVLRRTGQVRLAVLGSSMLPSLWPGDQLTIEAREGGQVRCEDIVAFRRDGRLFIHRALRILQMSPLRIITRGDAMPRPDSPVLPEELLGVVTAVCGADGRPVPIPGSSRVRRLIGLALAYSGRLRSLALRWHARRRGPAMDAGVAAENGSLN
jgi:hypothetical protein